MKRAFSVIAFDTVSEIGLLAGLEARTRGTISPKCFSSPAGGPGSLPGGTSGWAAYCHSAREAMAPQSRSRSATFAGANAEP